MNLLSKAAAGGIFNLEMSVLHPQHFPNIFSPSGAEKGLMAPNDA